ncbi:hypothetical protein [Paenibacillus pini]|nr:hypothetical protein [Paenibacillus pini]
MYTIDQIITELPELEIPGSFWFSGALPFTSKVTQYIIIIVSYI